MSKSTISTFQLFALIPDAETARGYLEARLWPNGPRCPVCGLGGRITARSRGCVAGNRRAIAAAAPRHHRGAAIVQIAAPR